jgi:hypothetical protein
MTSIAIIDFKNQDMGLKMLFPEADYFILEEEFDRKVINQKYNIQPIIHNKTCDVYNYIDDKKYDILLLVSPIYGALQYYNDKKKDIDVNTRIKFDNIMDMIKKNNFKSVCFFDNFDYDYDPNILLEINQEYKDIIKTKNVIFFKRYYNKEKIYQQNVFPFPYIIFGYTPVIDLLLDKNSDKYNGNKENRIFFSGSLLIHDDDIYNHHRNRRDIMSKICQKWNIYFTYNLPHTLFIKEMCKSKYCLDLLGVGDPNIRTFEILSSGSLKISQRTNIKWNFDDDFCEETFFDDENDFYNKMTVLENNPDIYEKCLEKQNKIVTNYMNKEYMRNYVISVFTKYFSDR